MKDFIGLFHKIIHQTVKDGVQPVTVQTGVMENSSEVNLDQGLTVTPTLSKIFGPGIDVHIKGVINGYEVEGDLNVTRDLLPGDKVKIIKEDGVSKYYLAEQL